MEDKIFEAKFKKLLEQGEFPEEPGMGAPPAVGGEMSDADAMASTLDDGSEAQDFEVNAPDAEAERLTAASAQQMFSQLGTWIEDIDAFVEFLNGTGPESMQSKLHSSATETVFEKVANAQTKKISRAAMDLSALSEALKGYLVTSNDPKYRYI